MTLIDPTSGVGYAFGEILPSADLTTIATQQPYALDIVNGGTYTLGGPLSITYNDALTYTLDAAATYTTNVGSSFAVTATPSTVSYDGDIAFTNVTTTFAFSGEWDANVDQINLRDDNAGSITVGVEEPITVSYSDSCSVTYTLGVGETHSGGSSYIYGDTLNREVTLGYTSLYSSTYGLTINGAATIETNGNTSVTANKPVSVIFSEGATIAASKAPMGTYSIRVNAYDDILVDDNTPMGTLTTTVEGNVVVQKNLTVSTGSVDVSAGNISSNIGYVSGDFLCNDGFTTAISLASGVDFTITDIYTRLEVQAVSTKKIFLPNKRKGTILWLSVKNTGPASWLLRNAGDTYTVATFTYVGMTDNYGSVVVLYWNANTPRVVAIDGSVTSDYGPW